jgi:ATP-dependent NAD(P)H-hydrate dehydratase
VCAPIGDKRRTAGNKGTPSQSLSSFLFSFPLPTVLLHNIKHAVMRGHQVAAARAAAAVHRQSAAHAARAAHSNTPPHIASLLHRHGIAPPLHAPEAHNLGPHPHHPYAEPGQEQQHADNAQQDDQQDHAHNAFGHRASVLMRHKGTAGGRLGIAGGCAMYAGAPAFAARAALTSGADLVTVACQRSATVAVHTLTGGEAICAPYDVGEPLSGGDVAAQSKAETSEEEALSDVLAALLQRVHVLVIGPGLGRDPAVLRAVVGAMAAARAAGVPLVVDGDGLFAIANGGADALRAVAGYTRCVLTPNQAEFARLCEVAGVGGGDRSDEERLRDLARALNGVTILLKGLVDRVCCVDGQVTMLANDLAGSPRRCGGQGDVLAGTLGTFMGWSALHASRAQAQGQAQEGQSGGGDAPWPALESGVSLPVACALTASLAVRRSAQTAFASHHRSTTTTHILEALEGEICGLFPDDCHRA